MRAAYYGERYGVKQGLHLNALGAAHRLLRQVFRAHFTPGAVNQL